MVYVVREIIALTMHSANFPFPSSHSQLFPTPIFEAVSDGQSQFGVQISNTTFGVSIYKKITYRQITVGLPKGSNSMPRTFFILTNFVYLSDFFLIMFHWLICIQH